MDEKMREKMILAIENAMRKAGAQNYEEGLKSATKFIEFLYNGVHSIQTIEGLRKTLDSCEPLSKSDERLILYAMEHLPSLMRIGLKLVAKKAAYTLPLPPSGRPPALSARESQEMLDYIWALNRKGTPMSAAKYRASQKYGCSQRTIARLCNNRSSIPDDKPTMTDVISRITKGE